MCHIIQIKWAGMQQKHPVSPKSQKFKVCHPAGKVMTTVFWDAGVIPAEFMTRSTNHCERLLWCAVAAAWGYLQGEMWTSVAVRDSAAWQCNSTEPTLDTRIVAFISLAPSRPSTLWTWPWATEATLGKSPTVQWWGRINCCEWKSLMPRVIEFLNAFHDRENVSVCWGFMLKNYDTLNGIREPHLTL